MIRCDSCANSKHCNKITSSNMECSQYVCNLNFSVGQTIYKEDLYSVFIDCERN